MAATAIVGGRRIYCDGVVGKLVVEPFARPLVVALPFVAATPIAIAASLFHGARLTPAGWAIMIAYAIAALVLLARIALAPPRVHVDFHTKRITVGAEEMAFGDAKIGTTTTASTDGKSTRSRAQTTLATKGRTLVLFDCVGDAVAVPEAFDAATRGEPATELERAIERVGTGDAKALIMRLVLLVAPGLMFAYAALF